MIAASGPKSAVAAPATGAVLTVGAAPAPTPPAPAAGVGAGASIEDTLAREGAYVSTTSGVSMWPMLRNRRDTVIVRPPTGRLRAGDVALYRRGDAYVLHRVLAANPGPAGGYVIRGDNCLERESVAEGQVIGMLVAFWRGERAVDMEGAGYRAYVRAWRAFGPVWRAAKRLRILAGRAARKVRRVCGGARGRGRDGRAGAGDGFGAGQRR